MSVEIKLKSKKVKKVVKEDEIDSDIASENCDSDDINNRYNKKCGNNKDQLQSELENRRDLNNRYELENNPNQDAYL